MIPSGLVGEIRSTPCTRCYGTDLRAFSNPSEAERP